MVPKLYILKDQNPGFTLLEIVITLAILSTVIVVSITSYTASQRNARDARRKTDLETIRQSLEVYRSSFGAYPNDDGTTEGTSSPCNTTTQKIKTCLTTSVTIGSVTDGPFISPQSYPKDPRQGNNYYYQRSPSNSNTYNLCAYMENFNAATDPACQITVSCGSVNCNYGLTQP